MKRTQLRATGWGQADRHYDFGDREPAVWRWVHDTLRMQPSGLQPAPDIDSIILPAPGLEAGVLRALQGLEDVDVCVDHYERCWHARGQSYHDLLHYRSGQLDVAPDAVVYPRTAESVVRVLHWARQHNISVVPFGGGTSVVGGVTARPGPDARGVVSLDTSLLAAIVNIDQRNRTATVQSGMYGPALEKELQDAGLTLGHYPQSFEFSTLGGWIAASGAGQQSNRYGKAGSWFLDAQIATPDGLWRSEAYPATAAGPRMGSALVGSEGALGVITEATVRVVPRPQTKDYRGFLFRDFEDAVAAVRTLAQSGIPLAMIRLSDPDETRFQGAFATVGKPKTFSRRLVGRWLRWKGLVDRPCLLLIGAEGDREPVRKFIRQAARIVSSGGGTGLGRSPGEHWYAGRFAAPYLRDPLMDRGIGVDTLETATRWSNLSTLYQAVTRALRSTAGENALVMTHVSHTYGDGASLYFTCVFPMSSDPIEQWHTIKHAASCAIVENGGTISHHHGVGEDHLPWMARDKGPASLALLRALKRESDPHNILNPGKLIGPEQEIS